MTVIEETYRWAYPLTWRRSTEKLILHHAGGSGFTAQDIHAFHLARGWSGIAYHYYVRRDGSVWRGRPEAAVGGHTEGQNHDSVGVCFEGDFERETMGDAQLRAGRALLADIRSRYPGLPAARHRDFCATACPGQNFPFGEMTREMTQEEFGDMAEVWLRELGSRPPADWSAEARAWAERLGLIQGDGSGGLQYGRPLTREEFVTLAYRLSQAEQ